MSKMLGKVSRLLTKAENAGTPEEAAAFMAKVQELASLNGIDLAVARLHQSAKERLQVPEERRIVVNPHARKRNRKHFSALGMAICAVNDVEVPLISNNDNSLFCIGFPSDLDVVEALFTHLSIQMAAECDEALIRGEHKETRSVLVTERVEIPWDERDWEGWNDATGRYYDMKPDEDWHRDDYEAFERGERPNLYVDNPNWNKPRRKPYPPPKYRDVSVLDAEGNTQTVEKTVSAVDGRVFRGDFYSAFVGRMRARLWEMRKSAERERGVKDVTSETALALRDKKAEVAAAVAAKRATVHHVGTYRGVDETERKFDHTGAARRAGRESAERVPVGADGRAVKR